MKNTPNLDFSIDRAARLRWRKRGIAILALGLSLQISINAWRWQTMDAERTKLQTQLHEATGQRAVDDNSSLTQEQRKSALALQDMLLRLAVPWDELLSAVEFSRTKSIVLESVQPHLEGNSLVINLRAPGFPELAEFVEALGKQDIFKDVMIVSESFGENDKGTLRAVVNVNWHQ